MFFSILFLFPPFARRIIFLIILKKMGREVFIDQGVYFRYPSTISIGNNVSVNRNCTFLSSHHFKNAEIIIGNNVRIGPGVSFFAAGHDPSSPVFADTAASIKIGDNVWIGGNSTILQGVNVNEGAVIGAGSVVTGDVPPYKIYAGNPAREIAARQIKN